MVYGVGILGDVIIKGVWYWGEKGFLALGSNVQQSLWVYSTNLQISLGRGVTCKENGR
jgi:hypothetical protein